MQSILFLSVMNGAAWGGSEEQWYQVALWMSKHNYKVGIAVFEWNEKKSNLDVLKKNGCTVYLIPNSRGILKNWLQKAALDKIPFTEYDMVYVNQGGWKDVAHGPFKSLYKKLPAIALSFHNYQLGANLPASKINILNAWIQKSFVSIAATGIIFKMLEEEYAIAIKNKEVSYSPVTFSPPGSPVTYPAMNETQPLIFVVLSALDIDRKAQDVLINALAGEQWKNRNWELHLYGEGKDKQVLESLVKKSGLENKVLLKGYTHNANEVLATAHLLIQATRFDAMPISVMEAMAMARPCLVSNVGDMPQWVVPGYNGFITGKVNEESLNEQLENAWNKRNEWEQMGKNAFATFQKKYPLPYEEKFVELLKDYFGSAHFKAG